MCPPAGVGQTIIVVIEFTGNKVDKFLGPHGLLKSYVRGLHTGSTVNAVRAKRRDRAAHHYPETSG